MGLIPHPLLNYITIMSKINKPYNKGVSNRFIYKGSEYDIRYYNDSLYLYRDDRFHRSIPTSETRINPLEEFDNRLNNLEVNETVYQIFEYVGTSTSGSIEIPEASAIFDIFGDGILDAIVVEADINQKPTNVNSINSLGEIVLVTSLNNNGEYTLDSTPISNSCILYYIKIRDIDKGNIPLESIISPGLPLSQRASNAFYVSPFNGDFTSVKEACDYVSTLATTDNPYTIYVYGKYTEDPFSVPAHVKLDLSNSILYASNNSSIFITMENSTTLYGGIIYGPTNDVSILVQGTTDEVVLEDVRIRSGYTGIKANNTGVVYIKECSVVNCSISGYALSNSASSIIASNAVSCGTGVKIDGNFIYVLSSMSFVNNTIDIETLDDLCKLYGTSLLTNIDKLLIYNYDNIRISFNSAKEADEALMTLQELHVGSAEKGFESIFGEGDSYTRGMLVYTYNGSSYTDVSDQARSASASTFTFPNSSINTSIYIASSLYNTEYLKHWGVRCIISQQRIGGDIVIEYWNGSSWVNLNGFTTNASSPYLPNAKNYFTRTGDHQLRYDLKLGSFTWVKNDPVGFGQNLYWVRFRITSSPTQLPIFEQFKLHSSKTGINSDGYLEYFGNARPYSQLAINIGNAKPVAGNMQSESIWVADNVGVGFQQNKFTTTADILGIDFVLPYETDTSTPIQVAWGGKASQAGAIQWTVRLHVHKAGDVLYTSNPVNTATDTVVYNGSTILNVSNTFIVELDASTAITKYPLQPGDLIWVTIQPTVLNGTFTLIGLVANYAKWCTGSHI